MDLLIEAEEIVLRALPTLDRSGADLETIIDTLMDRSGPCFKPDRAGIQDTLSELVADGAAVTDDGDWAMKSGGPVYWRNDA